VLIGQASNGTSGFYRMRARITRRLAWEKGFTIVAAEAASPDAARTDAHVRHRKVPASDRTAFARSLDHPAAIIAASSGSLHALVSLFTGMRRRKTAHSSFCSSISAPARRTTASRVGSEEEKASLPVAGSRDEPGRVGAAPDEPPREPRRLFGWAQAAMLGSAMAARKRASASTGVAWPRRSSRRRLLKQSTH
jgi:hypothetical protein